MKKYEAALRDATMAVQLQPSWAKVRLLEQVKNVKRTNLRTVIAPNEMIRMF
jgi:hypothetical protein